MNTNITISEGSFGIAEEINITSPLILIGDTIKIRIKETVEDDEAKVEKTYIVAEKTNDTCTILFELTEEDSDELVDGDYVYGIEHSRSDTLRQHLPLENNFYGNFYVRKGV